MAPADLRSPGLAGPPLLPAPRVADLHLRGRVAPVATRVYWPASCSSEQRSVAAAPGPDAAAERTALVVLLAGADGARGAGGAGDPGRLEALARGLCTYAGVVVLALRPPPGATGASGRPGPGGHADAGAAAGTARRDATTALDWAADHAAELGADPRRLVVAGWASGADVAAVVAHRSCEQGWPAIARQVLICPGPAPTLGPGPAAAVAPATVVTTGPGGDVGGGGALGRGASLRRAGVKVDELRYEGLPGGEPGWSPWTGAADLVMSDLARSLQHRLGLPPTAATRFATSEDDRAGGDRAGEGDGHDRAGGDAGEEIDRAGTGAGAGGAGRTTGGGFV